MVFILSRVFHARTCYERRNTKNTIFATFMTARAQVAITDYYPRLKGDSRRYEHGNLKNHKLEILIVEEKSGHIKLQRPRSCDRYSEEGRLR